MALGGGFYFFCDEEGAGGPSEGGVDVWVCTSLNPLLNWFGVLVGGVLGESLLPFG